MPIRPLLAVLLLPGLAAARHPNPPPIERREVIARTLDYAVTVEDNGIYGAGILIDPTAGLVITVEHVVSEMRSPKVIFADGTRVGAKVAQIEHGIDLALLEIPPQRRSAPVLGDATALKPGDELYAVGCPRHLGFTVSRGIVSFVGRPMDGARFVQSDLPINDGNSGGPVVNEQGELVAIMSFVLRHAQGLSFALPINYAAARFPRVAVLVDDRTYLERFRHWEK